MYVVCLIGKPAIGKGTQAELLETGFKFLRLTSSEELDKKKKRDPTSTALTQDELVIPVIDECLQENHREQELVLDGFPRSERQVDFVVEYAKKLALKWGKIRLIFLVIDVSDEWAISLNGIRYKTTPPEKRRLDDGPEAYADRLRRSHVYVPQVVDYINKVAPAALRRISGEGTPSEVHTRVLKAISDGM